MPVALQAPAALLELRKLATLQHLPDYARNLHCATRAVKRRHNCRLSSGGSGTNWADAPKRVSRMLNNAPGLAALRRLADAGLATVAAFTPSDALHVLGRQQGWNAEAAELGARLLAIEERNILGASEAAARRCFASGPSSM